MTTDEKILEELLFFCDIEDEFDDNGELSEFGKFIIDRFKIKVHE